MLSLRALSDLVHHNLKKGGKIVGWTRKELARLGLAAVCGIVVLAFGFWATLSQGTVSSRLGLAAVAITAIVVAEWNARSIPYTD